MDTVYSLKKENPRNEANILSKLFFIWMTKLCYKGTRCSLKLNDLYKTLKCDQSEALTDALQKNWQEQLSNKKKKGVQPSLTKAIVKTFFWKYMGFGVLMCAQVTILRSFQPFVLAYFIGLFADEDATDATMKYVAASILVAQSFFFVLFMHHIEFGQASIGMRIRIAVSSLIYRKMLRLSNKSIGTTAAGHMVNLLSNDVNRFDFVTLALHYLWIGPIQVVLVTYLIWLEMSLSTLAGVLFMLCFTLPVQGYLAKLTSKYRLQTARRTDNRVKQMNEIVAGIQIIKMYAWEKPFERIVKWARKKEIDVVTKSSYLRGVYLSCMVFIERTTLFMTVTCYVLLGNPITADKVFSIAQYFNVLQLVVALWYPMAISFAAETLVSVKRLQDFLSLEEKQETVAETDQLGSVVFADVDACWTSETCTLKKLNLNIPSGTLCAIVGPVGSGKSSILQTILGELTVRAGTCRVGGSVSYAAQEPWLFTSTVRNNILFGRDYDRALYRRVVKACSLETDFQQLSHGDATAVGDKGVSLSGGQRARINLARAVYRSADIYLLDDPLSAVDTHVGKHLFEECILKYLRDKTRILVTHQLQYLQGADYIVVLNEGGIEAKGTFNELMQSKADFTKLVTAGKEEKPDEKTALFSRSRTESIVSHKSVTSESSAVVEREENMEEMNYTNSTPFRDYVGASGNCCAIFCTAALLVLAQAACNCSDLWVTYWTESEAKANFSTTSDGGWQLTADDGSVNRNLFIYVYSAIVVVAIILTLLRSFRFFKMAMNSSKNLHNRMFSSILQTPMRFFDTNPSGRILNRFSRDMGAIDEFLPRVFIEAIQIILVLTGILIMVAIANYYMIPVMVIIGLFFLKVRGWYLATARDVKHLEGIAKSNVFSHLSSSFNGLATIRASRAEDILKSEFDRHQDTHTSAWFLTIATRVCFGLWLDMLSITFIVVVVFGFILLNQYSEVSGSFVGLAISQSLILTGMLQYGMRQSAEVVNQLTSVERVMQYTHLENENTTTKGDDNNKVLEVMMDRWPSAGSVKFQHLCLRYADHEPLVLNGLNVDVAAGEKVGIVGRTGAGKSSIIAALFRLAPITGHVVIDGVDTKTIELSRLRRSISIIPQEPVLFSATLRYNLDPFEEFNDEELWDALEQVELKEYVRDLSIAVSEGGSNFSLGQRQLVCLARAILRKNKVLVLDEATANVDPRTDSLIQQTIAKKFRDCTVLTIAHRLNTIMDADKVLVMSSGSMVEYGHPHVLLQDEEGFFTKMVRETGEEMEQKLRQMAEQCYDLKGSN